MIFAHVVMQGLSMNCRFVQKPTSHRKSLIQRGFTLIEVMVVIVILSLLAGIVVPQVLGGGDKARIKATEISLAKVANALKLYKTDNYKFPTTGEGLAALKTPPASAPNWQEGGYLDGTYLDGWERELQYYSPGSNGQAFDLYSLGADGQPGGEGADADLEYTP